MKKKFYIALSVTIISTIAFITTNFTHYFNGSKIADFVKGFSGGLACGAFIATISMGARWKRGKETQASAG